jgi:hypothetical protein
VLLLSLPLLPLLLLMLLPLLRLLLMVLPLLVLSRLSSGWLETLSAAAKLGSIAMMQMALPT